jgi:hypothetical protein
MTYDKCVFHGYPPFQTNDKYYYSIQRVVFPWKYGGVQLTS